MLDRLKWWRTLAKPKSLPMGDSYRERPAILYKVIQESVGQKIEDKMNRAAVEGYEWFHAIAAGDSSYVTIIMIRRG